VIKGKITFNLALLSNLLKGVCHKLQFECIDDNSQAAILGFFEPLGAH
jgi:hypothetical protein